jgi:hypothetical protein
MSIAWYFSILEEYRLNITFRGYIIVCVNLDIKEEIITLIAECLDGRHGVLESDVC